MPTSSFISSCPPHQSAPHSTPAPAQIKSLSNKRLDPTWSFAMFYLVKDSFGLMLEMAGMWADALQVK